MKQLVMACLLVFLSGCLSVPRSPTPRFYVLGSGQPARVNEGKQEVPGFLVGVGPVNVPEYLDRPHMVTQGKDKTLTFAQFDRWGEPLNLGLARLIGEDLTRGLPRGAHVVLYPWNSAVAVKYQVVVDIVRLDSDLKGDMFLVAQWLVIDPEDSKAVVVKRSEFLQPVIPQSYSGLAKTLSAVCASLSAEIADALAALEARPGPVIPRYN